MSSENLHFFFFCKHFVLNGESHRETEKVFSLPVYSRNGCNGQHWASLMLGARSFFNISHIGAGSTRLGPASAAFPGLKQRTASEIEQPGQELTTIRDADAMSWRISLLCHCTSPSNFPKSNISPNLKRLLALFPQNIFIYKVNTYTCCIYFMFYVIWKTCYMMSSCKHLYVQSTAN